MYSRSYTQAVQKMDAWLLGSENSLGYPVKTSETFIREEREKLLETSDTAWEVTFDNDNQIHIKTIPNPYKLVGQTRTNVGK